MERRDFLKAALGAPGLALTGTGTLVNAEEDENTEASLSNRTFYEIRRYRFDADDRRTRVERYLEEAAIPAYNRLGVEPVGVFDPVPDEDGKETDTLRELVVLLPFPSVEHLLRARLRLHEDPAYEERAASFVDLPESEFPYDRVGARLLIAFSEFPDLRTPGDDAGDSPLYELRTYEQYSEEKSRLKVEMMNRHVIDLFDDLGFRSVLYGNTLYGELMPSLTYMLAFKNRKERKQLWGDFGGSDEWQRLSGMERYKNTVSKVHNQFLRPVPYSQI